MKTGFWIFLFAFILQLSVLLNFAETMLFLFPDGDMRFYADWGTKIAKGEWTDGKAFYGLPGYAYLIGGISYLIGYDPFTLAMLQALAMAGVSWLLYRFGCWIAEGQKGMLIGAMAGMSWAFFLPAQVFSVVLMPTSFLVFVYWGILWWVTQTKSRSIWRPWLGVGLAIGLMATIVATIFFVLPLVVAAAARNLRHFGSVVVATLILLGGVIVGTSPCWLHNHLVAKDPVFLSAHSGLNFYIGNNPKANGYPRIPPGMRSSQAGLLMDSLLTPEQELGRPLKRYEVSIYWSEKTKAWISENYGDWLKLMARKFHNAWHATVYDDLSIIRDLEERRVVSGGISYGMAACLAIPGMLIGVWRYRRSAWIMAAVFLHIAALLPVFVTERYRMAAVPGLLLLAALGLVDLVERLVQRPPGWWKGAVAYPLVGAGAAAFVFVGGSIDTNPMTDYNIAVRELRHGNLVSAQRRLEKIYPAHATNAEVNSALGNLWMQKGDKAKAKWFYEMALNLEAKNAVALNRMSILWMEDEKWDLAAKALHTVYTIDPEESGSLYLLAYCLVKQGNEPAARNVVKYLKTFNADFPPLAKLDAYLNGEGELPPLPKE